jgi:hypothetical protein
MAGGEESEQGEWK